MPKSTTDSRETGPLRLKGKMVYSRGNRMLRQRKAAEKDEKACRSESDNGGRRSGGKAERRAAIRLDRGHTADCQSFRGGYSKPKPFKTSERAWSTTKRRESVEPQKNESRDWHGPNQTLSSPTYSVLPSLSVLTARKGSTEQKGLAGNAASMQQIVNQRTTERESLGAKDGKTNKLLTFSFGRRR